MRSSIRSGMVGNWSVGRERASVAFGTAVAAGTTIAVVDAVAATGATTTVIDAAAFDKNCCSDWDDDGPWCCCCSDWEISSLPASVADVTHSPDFSS